MNNDETAMREEYTVPKRLTITNGSLKSSRKNMVIGILSPKEAMEKESKTEFVF